MKSENFQIKNHLLAITEIKPFFWLSLFYLCCIDTDMHAQLNFDFQYAIIDTSRASVFLSAVNAHLAKDKVQVALHLEEMSHSVAIEKLKSTNYYEYSKIAFRGDEEYKLGLLELYQRMSDPRKAYRDPKLYNETMTEIYTDRYFYYYLDPYNSDAWALDPRYWFPASLDDVLKPIQLYRNATYLNLGEDLEYLKSYAWKVIDKQELLNRISDFEGKGEMEQCVIKILMKGITDGYTILIRRSWE